MRNKIFYLTNNKHVNYQVKSMEDHDYLLVKNLLTTKLYVLPVEIFEKMKELNFIHFV